jgi:hypothetical protein
VDLLVMLHDIGGVALVVIALIVGVWGMVRARPIGRSASPRESRVFAQLLQLVHTLVVAEGLFGVMLLAQDHRAVDPLHERVYGPFMVVVIIASYAYRTKDGVTNVRVFSIGALMIFALGLRALWTGA